MPFVMLVLHMNFSSGDEKHLKNEISKMMPILRLISILSDLELFPVSLMMAYMYSAFYPCFVSALSETFSFN